MSVVDLTVVAYKQVHNAFSSICTYISMCTICMLHIEIQRHLFKYNIMYF